MRTVLGLALLLQLSAAPRGAEPGGLVLTLKVPEEVRFGTAARATLEVRNTGRVAVRVSDLIEFERSVLAPKGGRVAPEMVQRSRPREPDHLRITLESRVPADAQKKFVAPAGPRTARVVTIGPGESKSFRIEMPADALDLGECTVQAVITEKEKERARSELRKVRCVRGRSPGSAPAAGF